MKTRIKQIFPLLLALLCASSASAANRFSVAAGGVWSSTATWSATSGGAGGASVPVAGDVVTIERGATVTVDVTDAACTTLQLGSTATTTSSGTLAFSGANPSLTVSGAVLMGASGNTARDGFITFPSDATLTAGSVTLGGTAATPAQGSINMTAGGTLSVAGNITVGNGGGTWTPGAGTVEKTAASTLPATIFTTFNNLTINGGTTTLGVNVAITGDLTVISGTLDLSTFTANRSSAGGTLTVSNGATLLVGGTANFPANYSTVSLGGTSTVNYDNGGSQTISSQSYGNLTLSGSGAKTLTGLTTVNGNLTLSGTATATTTANLMVGGNLAISGGTLTVAGFDFNVAGTATVSGGSLVHNSATGTKIYTGLVTISGGTWNNSGNSPVFFRGGLTFSSGTFTAGSGVQTFNANNQAIGGTLLIPSVTVTGVSLTNTGALTITTALAGTGELINDTTGTLNLNFTGTPGLATLTATAAGNTVNYGFAGTQTVAPVAYHHLALSGSGVKTLTDVTNIAGDLTVSGTATMTGNAGFTVGGTLNYNSTSGTTTLTPATPISVGKFSQNGTSGTFNDGGNTITVTGTGANTWNRANGTFTTTGTTIFNGAAPQIGAANFSNLTFDGSAAASTTGAVTVGGTLVIPSGTSLAVGGFAITVTGSTSVSGTLTHNNATGTKTYLGNVTINSGGVFSETAAAALVFGGNVTINNGGTLTEFGAATVSCAGSFQNDGDYTASTGTHTFSGATQAIGGASGISIPSLTVTGTYQNNGTLTVNTALAGAGTLTQGTGATLNIGGPTTTAITITTLSASANVNTVNYTGAAQTLKGTAYHHLGLSGSAAKTMTGVTGISGNLTLSGTATATAVAFTIGGNLDVGSGTTFTIPGAVVTVTGTTTVSGALTHNNATGLKTYTGNVTINSGGAWSETVAGIAFSFGGNLQNDGTLTATANTTGVHTFTGSSKTLDGVNAISIPSVSVTGTYQNDGTLTVGTALAGAGTLTQGASATLNIGGTSTITTLAATGTGNTVNYNGAGQTVLPVTYVNLTVSGSGTKSATANLDVSGTLTVSGAVVFSPSAGVVINSSGAMGTLTGAGTIQVTLIPGGLVDQYKFSTYTLSGLTVDYAGLGPQTVNGTSTVGNYGALTTSGASGTRTRTLDGDVTVNGGVIIGTGTTLDVSTSNFGLTVGGNWTGTGTFTPQNGTVTLNGGAQTITTTTTFYNLTLAGSGAKTITPVTTISGNLILSGTATAATAANFSIGGDLSIGNGSAFTAGGFNLTVTGTTTVGGGASGNMTVSSATGTKIFTGLVTVNSGASWANTSANSPVTFRGGLMLNGTGAFNAGTGVHTFDTSSQTLTGTISIPSVAVNSPTTLTNSGTLTVGTALSGTGALIQGANATLHLAGSSGITALTASAVGNTVNYNGGAQTVKVVNYHNLTLATSGAKTMTGVTNVSGDLSLSGSATATLAALTNITGNLILSGTAAATLGTALTVLGDISINPGTVLAAGANALNLAGDWINNRGVAGFTSSGAQTVTLMGSVAQSIGGSATTTFNNLTINKASGTATAGNNFTVASVFNIASGSTFDAADKTINLSGSGTPLVVGGTFTPSTSTVNYNGSSAVNVAGGINYHNLGFAASSIKTLTGGNISLTGDLNIGSGRFTLGSFTADRATSGGTLTIAASGELDIGGTNTLPANFATHLISSGSLVQYSGTVQTIAPLNSSQAYGTLVTLGTGTKTVNGSIEVVTAVNIGANAPIVVASGGLLKNSASSFTTTGTLTLNSGATFQHNRNGGTIPTATWDANSTCEIIGVTSGTSFSGGLGQTFGHFTWNSTGQTTTMGINGALTTVNGDFTVTSTGSGTLSLSGANGATLTIGGNFSQTGGTLLGSSSAAKTIAVAGDFSLSGGTLNLSSSSTAGNAVTVSITGNYSHTGGTLTESGSTTGSGIIFSSGTHSFISGGTVSQIVNFTASTGATLNLGTNLITGGGNFTNSAGATLGIGEANGITASGASGNIQNTGTRSFNTSGNYSYNGSVAQIVGNGLPAAVNNLTIANAAGVTLNTTHTVNGTATVESGALLLGTGRISNGPLVVNGTIAPGTGVGTFTTAPETWNGGGCYLFEISNASGAPGTGWDLLTTTNGTGVNLLSTSGDPFTIKLASLNGGTPGLAANFTNTLTNTWTILVATNGAVTNFSADKFVVDASAFSNSLAGGTFSVVQPTATNLAIRFTPTNPNAPVANPASYNCTPGLSVGIQITGAGGLASDPNNDPLTVTATTPTKGSAFVFDIGSDTFIYYLNNGTTGADSFNYTVNDGNGGIATATISITVGQPNEQSQNKLADPELIGGGPEVRLKFLGIPGYTYALEWTHDLTPTITWMALATNTASANGGVVYTNTPSGGADFYRTRWVP